MPLLEMSPGAIVRGIICAIFPSWYIPADQLHRGDFLTAMIYLQIVEGGYFHIQSTKPDTLGK